jgi:hypothetical protein
MATEAPYVMATEIELLYDFLGRRLGNGARGQSLEATLADFAQYRRELDELRASLREAEASSARGESGPLDLDALFARADKRLEAEGIPE